MSFGNTAEVQGIKITAMLSMRSEPELIAAKNVYDSGAIGEAVVGCIYCIAATIVIVMSYEQLGRRFLPYFR